MKKTQIVIAAILSISFSFTQASEFLYTGTFSDLKCIESEGDILGTEITILSGFSDVKYNYYALVQFAEGAAAQPHLIPISINNGTFSFKVNYLGNFDVGFSGKITKDSIIGVFGAPLSQSIKLERKPSFWSNPGDLCFR